MKLQRLYIGLLALAMLVLGACEKEETGLSVSRVTKFATFEMAGDALVFLTTGDSFQDPGAKAFEGDQEVNVTATGAVDTNTPGYYTITYSATNSDGFAASVVREIVVVDPDAAQDDLSGKYQGAGFGSDVVTITRLGPGYYACDKALASRNNIAIKFVHLGGENLLIYPQSSRFGTIAAAPGFDGTFAKVLDNGLQWVVYISCCGNFGPITLTAL